MIRKIINNKVESEVMLDEMIRNVKVENIVDMLFMSDDGYQTVSILIYEEGKRIDYLMRATSAVEIVGINRLLESLNLGITVEFVNYTQYECFIDYCMKLVKYEKSKAIV